MNEQQQKNETTEGRSELSGIVSFKPFSSGDSLHVINGNGSPIGVITEGSDKIYYFWPQQTGYSAIELVCIAARVNAMNNTEANS